jgi:hypothetical protein
MEQVSVSDPFIAPEASNDDFMCDDAGDCNAVSVDSVLLSERHVQRVIELLIPGIYFILLGIRYIACIHHMYVCPVFFMFYTVLSGGQL